MRSASTRMTRVPCRSVSIGLTVVTCGDVNEPGMASGSAPAVRCYAQARVRVGTDRTLAEHGPNLAELITCAPRIRGCWSFVHATVRGYRLQLVPNRDFRAHNGPRRPARRDGRPGIAGVETCGGVMVRGRNSGDGTRSSVYYLASSDLRPSDLDSSEFGSSEFGSPGFGSPDFGSPGFGSPDFGSSGSSDFRSADVGPARSRARMLREVDPLSADALAAEPVDSVSVSGSGGGWSGAGGRWLLWPLRVVLWAALLIVAFRGVTAIVFNQGSASPATGIRSASTPGEQFPVTLAEAYAAEFGQVYLNFSPQTQGQREQQLAAFVPASVAAADPDLGWNGVGQLNLQSEQVAGIAVQGPQRAVVTLLALVNGQLIELGVPIAASGGGVVVSGEPAWLPAPAQISLPSAAAGRSDPVAQSQLNNELPAFFQAYANPDSAALKGFLAPGVSLTGLGGTVAFDSIAALHVPPGGTTRQITVSVIWQLVGQGMANGAKLQVTYSMSVVQQSSVKWYVKEISASIEAVGAQ
jgi:hypothetical protein